MAKAWAKIRRHAMQSTRLARKRLRDLQRLQGEGLI